ncbi:MAG TPA: ComF family protein [Spirochaetota bacterium]|nr:ComF family protein [Spirochaetota bacterium]HQO21475.1 ComF family protein [Spirochaetota bacterium]HQQ22500.1 ComF family protein [Spirochaetota bacterium]
MKYLNCLLDVISPSFCSFCGSVIAYESSGVCKKCADKLLPYETCAEDSNPPDLKKIYYDKIYSLWKYNLYSRTLVSEFKNKNNLSISEYPAKEFARIIKEEKLNIDILTCIPISRAKLRKRGYNQAEYLSKKISINTGIPYDQTLKSLFAGGEQKKLDYNDRFFNTLGKFILNADVRGRSIGLIDDVMTTGATINEASRILKQGGALKISVFTMAKVEPFVYESV